MKMLARAGLALSALFACGIAHAGTVALPNCLNTPSTYTPCQGVVSVDPTTGNPLATQQSLALATANVAAAAQTVYGGTYIFAQMATAYGSVALQVLGPDGATYETIVSKTAADSSGGTAIQLQAGATVKVVLTSTTAANVTLTRVP